MKVDWQYILVASFGVTGIIQWLKGIVKDPKSIWSYISPFLCIGGAFLINGGWQNIVLNSILVLSVSQLGYDVLVKPIKKILGVPETIKETKSIEEPTGITIVPEAMQQGNGPSEDIK